MTLMVNEELACIECGTDLSHLNNEYRLRCDSCRTAIHKKRSRDCHRTKRWAKKMAHFSALPPQICPVCESQFSAIRGSTTYCSKACSDAMIRERSRLYQQNLRATAQS